MINSSLYLSIKYVLSLHRFSQSIPDYISVEDDTYTGLDSKLYPLKKFSSKKNLGRTIILFPGASPTAENHPSFQFLGAALANIGFSVFIPRIPLLKELNISEENVDWFENAYRKILDREDVTGTSVSCVAVSFGGALLMKCLTQGFMKDNAPDSILTYGAMYDVESSLEYMTKNVITIKGKTVTFKPNEWGLVVCFHNFLGGIDVGYDTQPIREILALRVQNLDYSDELNSLDGNLRTLMRDILESRFSDEVLRILSLIIKDKKAEFDSFSPKGWASKINAKVFIMHGASDNMVPYNQAELLSNSIADSELFISYLYEHNEISDKSSTMHKINEMIRLVLFFNKFIKHHEN